MNPATSSLEDVMEPETKESVILFAPPLGVGESIRTMSLERKQGMTSITRDDGEANISSHLQELQGRSP